MRLFLIIYILLTFAGPLFIALSGQIDFQANWQTANRESANIAPLADRTPEAVIQVYAARTFNWRGMFAVHTWMVVKPKNAQQYRVYQSIGWRIFRHLPPVVDEEDIPDRYWFDKTPQIILDMRGSKAEKLILEIAAAVKSYPFPNEYSYWPGPNSNTFIAYIARAVPALQLAMPSNAVGKDYLPGWQFVAKAPSGTGYQISLFGILGVMLAYKEGIEINILGLIYGISPVEKAIKLPGFGNIAIFK